MADEEDADIEWGSFDVPTDLSLFQLVTMCVLAPMDAPHGLVIAEALEDIYKEEINHGRLYPNLDKLAEKGLIDKRKRDNRTNEYELTQRGEYVASRWREFTDATVPEP